MVFETFAHTDKGGRKNNEDFCACDKNIWALADGLGGHDCGEIASTKAIEKLIDIWHEKSDRMDDENLVEMIKQVNLDVIRCQKENNEFSQMRTTLVFAVTDEKILKFANVGDSRFYYFRNNKIIAQSEDHSVSAAIVKLGEIRYEDIRFNEDRNKLLKVIGNNEDLKLSKLYEPIPLESGDAFLLCSDGFWEYVYEQEMEIDLTKSQSPEEWFSFMAKRVLLRTENKENDNFTAICVMVK